MVLFKVSWWEKHNNLTGMSYQCGSNGWCSSPNICELTTRGHCATSSKITPKWYTVFISFFNWSQGETLPVGGESRSRCRVAQAVWWVIGMSDAEWLRIPAATVFASCYSVLITWTYDQWAKNGLILKTWPSHKTDLPRGIANSSMQWCQFDNNESRCNLGPEARLFMNQGFGIRGFRFSFVAVSNLWPHRWIIRPGFDVEL